MTKNAKKPDVDDAARTSEDLVDEDVVFLDEELSQALVDYVLRKNSPRESSFIDELVDMCGMYFLDPPKQEKVTLSDGRVVTFLRDRVTVQGGNGPMMEYRNFGLFEDRVMMAKYFAVAEQGFKKQFLGMTYGKETS